MVMLLVYLKWHKYKLFQFIFLHILKPSHFITQLLNIYYYFIYAHILMITHLVLQLSNTDDIFNQ